MSNIEDTRRMRELVMSNVWPESILKKYHPRDDYDGTAKTALTELLYKSPALEVLIQGYTGNNTIDEGLLFYTSLEFDLLPRELMMTAADTKKFRKDFAYPVDAIQKAGLVKRVNDALVTGLQKGLDNKKKSPRPEWLDADDYEGENDSPSIWSTGLASAIKRIGVDFDYDPNVIFDTAYLLAMMPAMAGTCHIDSCLHGLRLSGLLSRDGKQNV